MRAIGRAAALGFWVMAICNAVLLVYAWINFAALHPDYFSEAWPTFSRALTVGDLRTYHWLAAIAGAGLFCGAASVAAMRVQIARASRERRGWTFFAAGCAAAASLLGIVHYFHVAISLDVDLDLHMLLSYTFFFGMTGVIVVDGWCNRRMSPARQEREMPALQRLSARRRTAGRSVLAAGGLFLATYILKDMHWNPWASATQKVFVCMETSWIVCTHLYALTYVTPVRSWFRPVPGRVAEAMRSAVLHAVALLAIVAIALSPLPESQAAEASAKIGGSGRIQPDGGVLPVVGPGGRVVEKVEVREGERVRRGAPLLVLADQATRALERELAEERLRNAERQALELPKTAELEAEAARIALSQARGEADALKGLDERTVAERERRQRLGAVTQAEAALQLAQARTAAVRQSSSAELRLAQTALKLADAAVAASRVTAPMDATVLQVNVQPGSTLGGGAALLLADTARMFVLADVFEGDLPRLKSGQPAQVSNPALGETLEGTVERIGRVIDPVNRLAKVWIRLRRSSPADRFIGMQVDVKIDAAGGGAAPTAGGSSAAGSSPAARP